MIRPMKGVRSPNFFTAPLAAMALAASVVVAGCGGGASDVASVRPESERNPVREYAIRNDAESIGALRGGDPRVNEGDENGWTPLHWAAALNHPEALVALLEKGANPNARAKGDETLLSESALRVFREFGLADFFAGWLNESDPVLMAAVYSNNPEVIAALVRGGADVNASSSNLVAPLHEAAGLGALQAMAGLIASGANPNIPDDLGFTPLDWALELENHFAASMLRRNGGKLGEDLP